MKRVASEIAAAETRIDVLVNNAGALFGHRQVTEDGLELTFALNHMAYFVLTAGLGERLLASAPARVVNTASAAHASATLDFDDLQSVEAYQSNFLATEVGASKYMVVRNWRTSCSRALARRLAGSGVSAYCLHPGFVATRFGDQTGGRISFGIRIAKRFALSPQEGAKTLVYLASAPEIDGAPGDYFDQCRPVAPSRQAQDPSAAERLWAEAAKLAGLPA